MNPITPRRLALAASAIVATLAVTLVPAATFAANDCHPVTRFEYPRAPDATLTAAQIGGTVVNRELDATGCDIGVYNPIRVSNANIHGAGSLGIVVDGKKANVKDSRIHHIGDNPILTNPLHGMQRGEGIYYINGARGTISGNKIAQIQKSGIYAMNGSVVAIRNNKVTGLGPIGFIAQNGIVIRAGSSAVVQGNIVSDFYYTPESDYACGIYSLEGGTMRASGNHLRGNEVRVCRED